MLTIGSLQHSRVFVIPTQQNSKHMFSKYMHPIIYRVTDHMNHTAHNLLVFEMHAYENSVSIRGRSRNVEGVQALGSNFVVVWPLLKAVHRGA